MDTFMENKRSYRWRSNLNKTVLVPYQCLFTWKKNEGQQTKIQFSIHMIQEGVNLVICRSRKLLDRLSDFDMTQVSEIIFQCTCWQVKNITIYTVGYLFNYKDIGSAPFFTGSTTPLFELAPCYRWSGGVVDRRKAHWIQTDISIGGPGTAPFLWSHCEAEWRIQHDFSSTKYKHPLYKRI